MALISRYTTSNLVNLLDEIYSNKTITRNCIIPVNDNLARLEIELAGYNKDDIEIYTENNYLYVKANRKGEPVRTYYSSWPFDENERIGVTKYENGLLSIEILKIVPEHQRRKNYKID
ncbi:MAG: hypothetical protein MUP85_17170 [Candidatus Lokiarchaeota archaeon]|nr:hypothetical protein [Candidatus Lokiarchaeota archaeon]